MNDVKSCVECPLCFNHSAFQHWTSLRQALVSLTTRSFNCVLCGHLSEGLDKYVLHLVSHDFIFNSNNNSSSSSNNNNNNCNGFGLTNNESFGFSLNNNNNNNSISSNGNNYNLVTHFPKKDSDSTPEAAQRLDIKLPTGTTCTVSSEPKPNSPSAVTSPHHGSDNSLDDILLNFSDFVQQKKSPQHLTEVGIKSIQVPLPFLGHSLSLPQMQVDVKSLSPRSDTRTVTPPTRWQTVPSPFHHPQQQQQQLQQHQQQQQQMIQNIAESITNEKIYKPEMEQESPSAGKQEQLPFFFVPNDHPQPKSPNLPGSGQAQCDRCGWNFDNESFLQVHKVLMHSNQRPSGMLHRHLNRIVEKYPCRECSLSFKNCDDFTSHLRRVHNDFRFVCHICAKMFKLKGSLLVHQRVVHQSAEGEGHHCKVCNRKFLTKYRRDVHERRHDSSNPFECGSCGLAFDELSKLEIHKEAHTTDLKCEICQRNFYTKLALTLHIASHQSNSVTNGLSPIKVEPVSYLSKEVAMALEPEEQADEVSQFSQSMPQPQSAVVVEKAMKQELVKSFGKDQDSKCWECDVCRKTFTTKYFLRKHKRLHTGETPYACNICGKSFTFQQSYHKHMLYHTDDKPYTCTQCGRAFKELSTLQNHERIHSGERPFACESCGKSFRQRVSYLVHRRIHTGVMPYDCQACGKSFRYKVTQRTHKCLGPSSADGSSDQDRRDLPVLPKNIQEDLQKLRRAKGLRTLHNRLQNVLDRSSKNSTQVSDVNLSFKMPSPLGQLQQLTISDHSPDEQKMSTNIMSTNMTPTMSTMIDDDVEMTRQKILADILSDDEKNIPENFETILNPIYFDFSS